MEQHNDELNQAQREESILESDKHFLYTYEQKEAFLQLIHDEIASKIIGTDALYQTSAKEYTD